MKKINYDSASEKTKGLRYRILYLLSTALIVFSAVVLSGCGESSYFENRDSGAGNEADISLHDEDRSDVSSVTNEESDSENFDNVSGSIESTENSKKLYVQIAGAVQSPGVYEMNEGDRVFQVIEKAGGLTEDAYESSVNQAKRISDGDFIRIYTISEAEKYMKDGEPAGLIENSSKTDAVMPEDASESAGLININTASKDTLMTLPGIGESKADSIISYRSEKGLFKSIDEIKNISGIKEKAFAKIKDLITV